QIRDGPYPSTPVQAGLYYRDLVHPKPALTAFRFPVVAYLVRGGISVWGRTPDSQAHAVGIELSTPAGWRRIAAVQAGRSGIFHATVHARATATNWIRAKIAGNAARPFSL